MFLQSICFLCFSYFLEKEISNSEISTKKPNISFSFMENQQKKECQNIPNFNYIQDIHKAKTLKLLIDKKLEKINKKEQEDPYFSVDFCEKTCSKFKNLNSKNAAKNLLNLLKTREIVEKGEQIEISKNKGDLVKINNFMHDFQDFKLNEKRFIRDLGEIETEINEKKKFIRIIREQIGKVKLNKKRIQHEVNLHLFHIKSFHQDM